ncbi:serine--tRNA ligase, mitochondrial [Anthonomus grandis grandis]|uniref:serine--tRNA ligase, mitochondrial n=1 Tax=Anthonomus grandis grandis TaxID=2921223 RepID=UPI002166AB1F|nr:serine--tRNA ligase, mitochondrial [Anthonomus grandis grandis]
MLGFTRIQVVKKCNILNLTFYLKATHQKLHTKSKATWSIPTSIDFDEQYLCNPDNLSAIKHNIENRKGIGNIALVQELYSKIKLKDSSDKTFESLKQEFQHECALIPNKTHPDVMAYGDNPKVLKYIGEKPKFDFKHKDFHDIAKRLNLMRNEHLGNLSGNKSYYLLGEMAELEQALIKYFVKNLLKNKFDLISVPDILPRNVVESCGLNTRGDRTLVYTLDPDVHGPDLCLSGTSEIALAGYLGSETIDQKYLPLKLCAVSRCYRAESSSVLEERGIFRVHEFTKVEMFIAAKPDQSDEVLENIRSYQEDFFKQLDIHFQVLDMPPHDLGAQAYRKYDIEAWMPGRDMYGEISSCSNCIDFQSRRLNIKYKAEEGSTRYVHTLNGTACAIPRLLIALTETHQQSNGTVNIPTVLQPFMRGKTSIARQKKIPDLKLIKNKKS